MAPSKGASWVIVSDFIQSPPFQLGPQCHSAKTYLKHIEEMSTEGGTTFR